MKNITNYIEYLKTLDLISDLIYFEGPILSLSADKIGNLFIYKWCGLNEEKQAHEWLVFHVSFDALLKYIKKNISELELVESAIHNSFTDSLYLLLSITENLTYSVIEIFPTKEEIPNDCKPQEDVFFEEDYCENIATLKTFLANHEPSIFG